MIKISKEETAEFLASLVALTAESNSDQDCANQLYQLGLMKAGGLREYLESHSAAVLRHMEVMTLERSMIAHLLK